MPLLTASRSHKAGVFQILKHTRLHFHSLAECLSQRQSYSSRARNEARTTILTLYSHRLERKIPVQLSLVATKA